MPERFFGQQGEDKILYELFREQVKGFYVDVGASDGVTFSNTYIFEQMGWDGICVEPHPDEFAKLSLNRSNSLCLHAMAGENVGYGWLMFGGSTTRRVMGADPATIPVPMVTLNFVLELLGRSQVDFVSIDAEFTDEKVLEGLDLGLYRPRVVVVEQDNAYIDHRFVQAGYIKARRHYFNSFFCLNRQDAEVIRSVEPHMENGVEILTGGRR